MRAYIGSLPERLIRSISAVVGGLAHGTFRAVLPGSWRQTRLYHALIDSTLQFLIQNVGQVEGPFDGRDPQPNDFVLRRTVGNGIEIAGLLAFRASPVWVLAILADLSGCGRYLLRDIGAKLREDGVFPPGIEVESVDQLLDGIEAVSGRLSATVNAPPLDVPALRREWADLQAAAARMPQANFPGPAKLQAAWRALEDEARRQNQPVLQLSGALTLSAFRGLPKYLVQLTSGAIFAAGRAGELLAGSLVEHYQQGLRRMHREGYWQFCRREFSPYLIAAASHFSPEKESSTERWLRRRSVSTTGKL